MLAKGETIYPQSQQPSATAPAGKAKAPARKAGMPETVAKRPTRKS